MGDPGVGKTNQLQIELAMQTYEPLAPGRFSFPASEMGPAGKPAARTYCVMVPSLEIGRRLGH